MVLQEMFTLRGKTARRIGEDRTAAYEQVYRDLATKVANGTLPSHPDYLGGNELASNIYRKKYFVKDLEGRTVEQRPEDVFVRLASFLASTEETGALRTTWSERFYTMLYDGRFISGGRVLAGAGDLYRMKTLANCFVTTIKDDNIESIYQAAYECARTYSYGGGIGVDISCLRPKDSVVHNAADRSTGSVSFMDLFSMTTGLIGQSGRRGALMLTIDIKHPDVLDFIRVKKVPNWVTHQIVEQCQWSGQFDENQLREIERQVRENTQVRFANISIKATDEFMQAVDEQTHYGPSTLLVYRKFSRPTVRTAYQDADHHYSYGIPSKDIGTYEFAGDFSTLEGLNTWLVKQGGEAVTAEQLADAAQRDVYGDLVVELASQKFDLAVRYAGDFMLYFASEQTAEIRRLTKAREIWDTFVESNYHAAEPGLILWTAMSKYSPSNYVGRPIACTNPCAEVPLEEGGACNLGSINLSRFVVDGYTDRARIDWDALWEVTQYAVRFLDNVVYWNEKLNPLEKQRRAASETRRLGLGVMGIADMLNQLGKMYDSDEAVALMEKVMETLTNAAYQSSALIAGEKGASPIFTYENYARCPFFQEALNDETRALIKKHGVRNIAIMSIAPTGSISNIVLGFQHGGKNFIGVSGGVEPIFALFYSRRSESFGNQIFRVFHSTVSAYLEMHGLMEDAQKKPLEEILPAHFFRTAHVIGPDMRVQVQATCQKYVDHSISSTVNLAEDIEPEVISRIYLQAWKKGLKGITIYRDGSRYPILSVDGKSTPFQEMKNKKFSLRIPHADGDPEKARVQEVSGEEVIRMPDGRLTTVYHLIKRKEQTPGDAPRVSETLVNKN